MTSHIEQKLASMDLRFQYALADARTLETHSVTMGAQFEDHVREIIELFVPSGYRVRGALLPPRRNDPRHSEKQLDLVVHPASVPRLYEELPMDWITVVGEVKTTLNDKKDIQSTAEKLADSAVASPRQAPVPFFVLAGSIEGSERWLSDLVASVASNSLSWTLWPAVFIFDRGEAMSAFHVNESSPIRALTADGEFLSGVVTIPAAQLTPSTVCYLWLWAAVYAADAEHPMDFRYMREEFERLCGKEGGIEVRFRTDSGGETQPRRVFFRLPDDQALPTVRASAPETAPAVCSTPAMTSERTGGAGRSTTSRRVMLITLGTWVDEPDTWDESAWGGSANATRSGYGYYSGMADLDLLNSCRLFWKFNPRSPTWQGIEYAVVAHDGITRAVVHIDRTIGPFWGRWGFQGQIITSGDLVRDFVGREVPRRQNPLTTIVNGQVAVPTGGQLKVPTSRVDHLLVRVVPPRARAWRMR